MAATPATCAAARRRSALTIVHTFTVSPDDVTVGPMGRLWVSAREANLLFSMTSSGSDVATQPIRGGPEGVATYGATLYVAQQDLNAVEAVGPSERTVITIPNHTHNAGIDGIGTDASNHRLLVPDSPSGRLLSVALDDATAPQLIASGLGRPVAVTVDPAGTVFVASESSPGLWMLPRSGPPRPLGTFNNLDEVVYYGGLLYVSELDKHDVLAIDPSSGASAPVAVDLPAPQGLAVTAGGVLEIVDSTTRKLYAMPACGVS